MQAALWCELWMGAALVTGERLVCAGRLRNACSSPWFRSLRQEEKDAVAQTLLSVRPAFLLSEEHSWSCSNAYEHRFSSKGAITSCDRLFAHLHGYASGEEVVGQRVTDLIPSLQLPPAGEHLPQVGALSACPARLDSGPPTPGTAPARGSAFSGKTKEGRQSV